MAELARAHGIKVVLASLLPVSDDKKDANGAAAHPHPPAADRDDPRAQPLAGRVRGEERPRVPRLLLGHWPTRTACCAPSSTTTACTRTPRGYAVMAPLAEKAIAQALRRRDDRARVPSSPLAAAAAAPQAEPRPGQRPGGDRPPCPPSRTELVQLDVVVTDKDGRCVDGTSPRATSRSSRTASRRRSPTSPWRRGPGLRAEAAAPPVPEAAPARRARAGRSDPARPPLRAGRRRPAHRTGQHGRGAAGDDALRRRAGVGRRPRRPRHDERHRGRASRTSPATRTLCAGPSRASQSRYEPVEPGGAPYLSEYQAELIDRGDVEALRLAVEEILQTEDYLGEVGAREKAYAQARRMVFEIMARSGRALATIEGVVRGPRPAPRAQDGGARSPTASSSASAPPRTAPSTCAASRTRRRARASSSTRSTPAGLVADVPGGSASFQGPGVLTAPGARAEPAGARQRGAAAGPERAGRGHRRLPGPQHQRPLPGLRPDPARQRGLLPARLRAHERRPRREVPEDRGPPAGPGRACACGRGAATSLPTIARRRRRPRAREALREREIGQALGSLFPLEGVPMRMSADFIDLPPAGPQAVIRTHLDVSGVPFVPAGDRYAADLEIAGAVYDETGHLVGEVTRRTGAAQPDRGDLPEGDERRAHRPEDRRPPARPLPGPHGGARGDAVAPRQREPWVEIPDVAAGAVTLSSVFLLADAGPGGTDLTDVQVDRRFRRGQGLHYVVHAYGLPSSGGATPAGPGVAGEPAGGSDSQARPRPGPGRARGQVERAHRARVVRARRLRAAGRGRPPAAAKAQRQVSFRVE